MATYTIHNTTSSLDLGVFHGDDELDAYLDMCRDASAEPERDEDGEIFIPDDLIITKVDAVRSYESEAPIASEPGDYPY